MQSSLVVILNVFPHQTMQLAAMEDMHIHIIALSPPIYDYVVMSHEGATPVAPVLCKVISASWRDCARSFFLLGRAHDVVFRAKTTTAAKMARSPSYFGKLQA